MSTRSVLLIALFLVVLVTFGAVSTFFSGQTASPANINNVPNSVTKAGTIFSFHNDNFDQPDKPVAEYHYRLYGPNFDPIRDGPIMRVSVAGKGVFQELKFDQQPDPEKWDQDFPNGSQVTVTGIPEGNGLKLHGNGRDSIHRQSQSPNPQGQGAVISSAINPPAPTTLASNDIQLPGKQNTLVVLYDFLDRHICPTIRDQLTSTTMPISVEKVYQQSTYGASGFNWTVIGPYTVNATIGSNPSCTDVSNAIATVDQQIAASGIDANSYQVVAHIWANNNCTAAGIGGTGSQPDGGYRGSADIQDTDSSSPNYATSNLCTSGYDGRTPTYMNFMAHELGHSLGLKHANGLAFQGQPPFTSAPYYDPTDFMGGSSNISLGKTYAWLLLNAAHREDLVVPSRIQPISTTGTYQVANLDTDPSSTSLPHVLKITRPATADYYYLSYRSPTGIDGLPAPALCGTSCRGAQGYNKTSIHINRGYNPDPFQRIDTLKITFLDDNEIFSDPTLGLIVKQLSHSPGSATLQVTFGPVSPDTTPPTTVITSPTNGQTIPTNSPVQATATDALQVVKVEFWKDSDTTPYQAIYDAPYSGALSMPNGPHTVYTKAYDLAGNIGISPIVNVTIGTATAFPLMVAKSGTGTGTVTSSPSGINCGTTCSTNFNSGTSVTLTATANTGSTFTGWSGDCSGIATCVVNMTAAHNVTATFTASTGDTTLPTTSITSPASGATVSGTITVQATAADNVGVTTTSFKVDGTTVATDTSSPYSYSWNTATVSNGSHNLTTTATDQAGNIGTSATVTVNVQNVAPNTPVITSSSVTSITTTSATINWATNIPTTGMVKYGTSRSNLNLSRSDTTATTTHAVFLTGLSRKTTYYYQIIATNPVNGLMAQTAVLNFRTKTY